MFGSLTVLERVSDGFRVSCECGVERVDNDAGYWPGNVRWATPAQQATNRRPKSHYRGVPL